MPNSRDEEQFCQKEQSSSQTVERYSRSDELELRRKLLDVAKMHLESTTDYFAKNNYHTSSQGPQEVE